MRACVFVHDIISVRLPSPRFHPQTEYKEIGNRIASYWFWDLDRFGFGFDLDLDFGFGCLLLASLFLAVCWPVVAD